MLWALSLQKICRRCYFLLKLMIIGCWCYYFYEIWMIEKKIDGLNPPASQTPMWEFELNRSSWLALPYFGKGNHKVGWAFKSTPLNLSNSLWMYNNKKKKTQWTID